VLGEERGVEISKATFEEEEEEQEKTRHGSKYLQDRCGGWSKILV
jgi:hypothetical protein